MEIAEACSLFASDIGSASFLLRKQFKRDDLHSRQTVDKLQINGQVWANEEISKKAQKSLITPILSDYMAHKYIEK